MNGGFCLVWFCRKICLKLFQENGFHHKCIQLGYIEDKSGQGGGAKSDFC